MWQSGFSRASDASPRDSSGAHRKLRSPGRRIGPQTRCFAVTHRQQRADLQAARLQLAQPFPPGCGGLAQAIADRDHPFPAAGRCTTERTSHASASLVDVFAGRQIGRRFAQRLEFDSLDKGCSHARFFYRKPRPVGRIGALHCNRCSDPCFAQSRNGRRENPLIAVGSAPLFGVSATKCPWGRA